MAKLMSHESMRKKEGAKISYEGIMVASDEDRVKRKTIEKRGGFKPKGHSQSRFYQRKCYYYDKEVHIVNDCSKPKANKAKGKSEDAAVVKYSMDRKDDVLTISSVWRN